MKLSRRNQVKDRTTTTSTSSSSISTAAANSSSMMQPSQAFLTFEQRICHESFVRGRTCASFLCVRIGRCSVTSGGSAKVVTEEQ
ncbi:unnamed protein product [Soboliphyme baturini]|uniref:Uncharacterized protein n=1 Tax=Soboliphyme baturini TaxID=241478 RepID=A0A183IX54_9BILA|nr:unnamed protein product [Soboliphyme baturini]